MTKADFTVSLLATLLAASAAFAQEEPVEPRQYNVEIIVFTYEQEVSTGSEVFIPDEVVQAFEDLLPDLGEDVPDDAAEMADVPEPANEASSADLLAADVPDDGLPDFVITPVDELGMTDIAEKLERLDVYKPIMHVAWTQPALAREESIILDIDMLTEPPAGLSGSFQMYLSRFLHLKIDLSLGADDETPVAVEIPGAYDFRDDVRQQPGIVRFRIDEDRIFKNGDTRYFDHPKFGVLARITRIEEPEEEEPLSGDDALMDDIVSN